MSDVSVASDRVALMICPRCRGPLRFQDGHRLCCELPGGPVRVGNILIYEPEISSPEMIVRDRQADGYLSHVKLPTQIHRMRSFIAGLPSAARPVLDLGCGPGPATEMLTAKGFEVVAVDFSRRCLELNKARGALFVQADLRDIRFAKDSVDGLMMADFLQHLGGPEVQKQFLQKAFDWLAPGGWFFLSAFNANIKNRLRADIDGAFAGGKIRYRRMTPADVLGILPPTVKVDEVRPMNVFHRPKLDDFATRFPWARLLARMIVLTGRKI